MKKLLTTLALSVILIAGCKKNTSDVLPPTVPLVTTAALTNTGNGNYTTGGSIVSNGGATVTQSGIVWSKINATPTLTDTIVAGITATGAFTSNISNIDFNTTYYFRAFATNSVGTGYGNVVSLTTSNDSVRFTYNGQSVTYGIIISPTTGKKWLDRNLGAKRQATALDDYQAYGDLFQWGRPADGHQLINWTSSTAGTAVNGTTSTKATSDNPGHSDFITADEPNTSHDWRISNNANRWATNPQGTCPVGWHVPTMNEWRAELFNGNGGTAISGGITNASSAYSLLKLTSAGYREGLGNNGPAGSMPRTGIGRNYYWSSSIQINQGYNWARLVLINNLGGDMTWAEPFSLGMPVRCIKDN